MERMKLILKGLLLWATALYTSMIVLAIDGLSITTIFINMIIIVSMIQICRKNITFEEFKILSLHNWYCKTFGLE